MSYINKVILVGNVGQDPVIRAIGQDKSIASINIATTEFWKDRSTGDRRDKTEWHKVVIFNDNNLLSESIA